MDLNKSQLENLTAAERVEKLKAIAKAKKQEIEEVESLLKSSEEEARIEEVINESVEIPQNEPVDISSLFTPEEISQIQDKDSDEEDSSGARYEPSSGEFFSTYTGLGESEASVPKMETSMQYTLSEGQKNLATSTGGKALVEEMRKYQRG